MWAAIQSVYNGTWGGGGVPQEIVDFEICHEMHLSWDAYQRTPVYVRRVWWDCILAKREAENDANQRQAQQREGTTRVRR